MKRFVNFRMARPARLKNQSAVVQRLNKAPKVLQAAIPLPSSNTRWWAMAIGFIAFGVYIASVDAEKQRDPAGFKKFKLIAKESISASASIFTLKRLIPMQSSDLNNYSHLNAILSVEIKQPLLQIVRRYTPLPISPAASRELGSMRFMIRHEVGGEVSSYLHGLPVNRPARESLVDIRGPYIEYTIPHDASDILFLAGGTGIAPALQVAAILKQPHRETPSSMQILWANRQREECIGLGERGPKGAIAQEISFLQQRNELTSLAAVNVECFVDEEGSFINERVIQKYMDQPTLAAGGESIGKKIILISGSDGFVKHLTGSTRMEGWQARAEKPVGGILSKLNLDGWEVVKL